MYSSNEWFHAINFQIVELFFLSGTQLGLGYNVTSIRFTGLITSVIGIGGEDSHPTGEKKILTFLDFNSSFPIFARFISRYNRSLIASLSLGRFGLFSGIRGRILSSNRSMAWLVGWITCVIKGSYHNEIY